MEPTQNGQETNDRLARLREIVNNTLEEEQLVMNHLLNPPKEILSRGQRISDQVARFGGSWKFIILFSVILAVWIVVKSILPPRYLSDAYPFILMNLILSCIAALQAPIIMISQNRQEEKDRLRGENDYMINLKAELEIRSLHQKLDFLLESQMEELHSNQTKQKELLEALCVRLNKGDEMG